MVVRHEAVDVESTRHRVVGVDVADDRRHLAHPGPAGGGRGRPGEQVGLVAEVPHPDRRMLPVRADDGGEQQPLGGERRWIVERVAVGATDDPAAADDLARVRRRRLAVGREQPSRRPVGAAHVPGEERDVELQATLRGGIAHPAEIAQAAGRDHVGRRHPVVPQQEQPHAVHPERGDHVELVAHLAGVEVRPPRHRLVARPVVAPQPEPVRGVARSDSSAEADASRHGHGSRVAGSWPSARGGRPASRRHGRRRARRAGPPARRARSCRGRPPDRSAATPRSDRRSRRRTSVR